LATQVLSASVADAIEFCNKDLGLQQFANSEATCDSLRICNMAFYLLDSKVPFTKNTKIVSYNNLLARLKHSLYLATITDHHFMDKQNKNGKHNL
jgi:hypothetical protein